MGAKTGKDFIRTQRDIERKTHLTMSTIAENKQTIRAFLAQYIRNHEALQDDEDMFAAGLVNSLFAMQLVLFIESDFGIRLPNSDLRLDNFRTIDNIADLIQRKMGN